MDIGDIPSRSNGDDVEAAWWNIFRTFLRSFFGTGVSSWSDAVALSNGATAQDVTGVSFDSAKYKKAVVEVWIERSDDSPTVKRQTQTLIFSYSAGTSSWIVAEGPLEAEDAGVTWSITTSSGVGQLEYTTTTYGGGSHSCNLYYKVKETLAA